LNELLTIISYQYQSREIFSTVYEVREIDRNILD